ncbi:MAG: hypothetical protein HY360_05450 [Verrucomicrobia bacterium]|nr:hypothetical protein [Verrucomicrobiota bacterium]
MNAQRFSGCDAGGLLRHSMRSVLFIGGYSAWTGLLVAAEPTLPKGYPAERYDPVWKRSPFTLSSVEQETVKVGFAQQLALVGVAKIGSAETVMIVNKQSQERFTVSEEPGQHGIRLISIQQNLDPLKVAATLKKGDETAVVRFDPVLLKAASAVQPTVHPPMTTANNPAGAAPALGQPVQVQASPAPSPPQPPPTTNEVRRRIIIPANPPVAK